MTARLAALLPIGIGLVACASAPAGPAETSTALTAGAATVFDTTQNAFSLPIPGLTAVDRSAFFVGNSFFNQNWISAPASVESRDGLGPLFNARSCSTCHLRDGRGRAPAEGEALQSLLLRVSIPGVGAHGEPLADPVLGDQVQGHALPGLPPEAAVLVEHDALTGAFADGEPYSLRAPRYRLIKPGYGELRSDLLVSPRVAPFMIGLGLLEAVPEADILARADPGDLDRDGLSGRANRVWDRARKARALGRFGWKAEQPSVSQQTAGAFSGDMGITSSLFPAENHSDAQRACHEQPSGGRPEIDDATLEKVVRYARMLAVPARRNPEHPEVVRGAGHFARARCDGCHVPRLTTQANTQPSQLASQTLAAYTDLLLHDMGEGLADQRPAFEASGREWRTPPLWGLGLIETVNGHRDLLHDGRARGVSEAILWHGGEAEAAKQAFLQMSRDERDELRAFVESL